MQGLDHGLHWLRWLCYDLSDVNDCKLTRGVVNFFCRIGMSRPIYRDRLMTLVTIKPVVQASSGKETFSFVGKRLLHIHKADEGTTVSMPPSVCGRKRDMISLAVLTGGGALATDDTAGVSCKLCAS